MPPTRGQISRIKSALPARAKGFPRKGASGVSPQISGTSVSIGPRPMQGHITQPVLTPAVARGGKDGGPGQLVRVEIPWPLARFGQKALVVVDTRVHRPAARGHGDVAGIGQRWKYRKHLRCQRAAIQQAGKVRAAPAAARKSSPVIASMESTSIRACSIGIPPWANMPSIIAPPTARVNASRAGSFPPYNNCGICPAPRKEVGDRAQKPQLRRNEKMEEELTERRRKALSRHKRGANRPGAS